MWNEDNGGFLGGFSHDSATGEVFCSHCNRAVEFGIRETEHSRTKQIFCKRCRSVLHTMTLPSLSSEIADWDDFEQ